AIATCHAPARALRLRDLRWRTDRTLRRKTASPALSPIARGHRSLPSGTDYLRTCPGPCHQVTHLKLDGITRAESSIERRLWYISAHGSTADVRRVPSAGPPFAGHDLAIGPRREV